MPKLASLTAFSTLSEMPLPASDSILDWTRWLIKLLSEIGVSNNLVGVVLWTLLVSVAVYWLFKALNAVLEGVGKIGDHLKAFGWHTRLSPESRLEIRRRAQFCSVLHSDLATLAKAENWNDQFFAELEAEVEVEGAYFPSMLHRLLNRPGKGLRRVPSLTAAICDSGEKRILVVGDPGSGKSVALRHVAATLAKKAQKSYATTVAIPLYINLRELVSSAPITGDSIKQFVLSNIRRGDSDTAAYVNEKWNEFKTAGSWMFLFDSFDEIPEVLHSPTEDRATHRYAQAIQHFLDAAPACIGVVASREFKGPRQLKWHKCRILKLSDRAQNDLVERAFLNSSGRSAVRQHIATSDDSTFRNPMLLSLLCRFVKDQSRRPNSDYDLLLTHIQHLSRRDAEYLKGHFGLTPTEVLEFSEAVAKEIAESPSLGLSPSFSELAAAIEKHAAPEGVQRKLSALVELKIGRVDVPNAAPGDRRFAFSHRRYQEVLYVSYMRAAGAARRPRELLIDPRWREYAVTFLQSQPLSDIAELVDDATFLIERASSRQTAKFCETPLDSFVGYFDWDEENIAHILGILRAGFSARVAEIPVTLGEAIERLLSERWKSGDAIDLAHAVKFSGMVREQAASEILGTAMSSGVVGLDGEIIDAIAYRGSVPHGFRETFLEGIADATLDADNVVELARLEAMAARLPQSTGAGTVFERNRKTRSWLRPMSQIVFFPLSLAVRAFPRMRRDISISNQVRAFPFPLMMLPPILWATEVSGITTPYNTATKRETLYVVICLLAIAGLFSAIKIATRAYPKSIRGRTLASGIMALPALLFRHEDARRMLLVIPLTAVAMLTPGALVHGIAALVGLGPVSALWYAVAFLVSSFLLVLAILIQRYHSHRRYCQNLNRIRKEHSREIRNSPLLLPLSANSLDELMTWISVNPSLVAQNRAVGRTLLKLLRVRLRASEIRSLQPYPIAADLSRSASGQSARRLQTLIMQLLGPR